MIQLEMDQPLQSDVKSHHLRGAMASTQPDNILFHHHHRDGQTVYAYPFIQYKILDGQVWLVGLEKGAEALQNLDLLETILDLGKKQYQVARQLVSFSKVKFGWCSHHLDYEFQTPWMALNQNNYERYHRIGDPSKKTQFLENILVGNLLSMSKSIDYSVDNPIRIQLYEFHEVATRLKGNPMTAFKGRFSSTFSIPDFWGIGKSTSRGFGTVINV